MAESFPTPSERIELVINDLRHAIVKTTQNAELADDFLKAVDVAEGELKRYFVDRAMPNDDGTWDDARYVEWIAQRLAMVHHDPRPRLVIIAAALRAHAQ